jgi:hypothetical protein
MGGLRHPAEENILAIRGVSPENPKLFLFRAKATSIKYRK